jgi:Reverse transcriptase (RNA-dependent DNA polymerase)
MGSKFHLVVKNSETAQPVCKARLVISGHMDAEKGRILSEAPTVSQMSIRTLISLSVVNVWPIWSRDIRQAFLQSESLLSRTVYMRPQRQLQASYKGQLMRLKKPLYGIVEAPSYWYDTYIPAFKAPPTSMAQSFLDECLLFTVPPVAHSDVFAEESTMKSVV